MTINGGAGVDTINFNATTDGIVIATASNGITGLTAGLGVIVYSAGDILQFDNSALSVTGANWAGAGGQVMNLTSLSGYSAVSSSMEEGGIAVFSDGTDTAILVKTVAAGNANSTSVMFTIKGADLQLTTSSTGFVNTSSANYGFTLAALSGTAGAANSYGVSITLL